MRQSEASFDSLPLSLSTWRGNHWASWKKLIIRLRTQVSWLAVIFLPASKSKKLLKRPQSALGNSSLASLEWMRFKLSTNVTSNFLNNYIKASPRLLANVRSHSQQNHWASQPTLYFLVLKSIILYWNDLFVMIPCPHKYRAFFMSLCPHRRWSLMVASMS